MLRVHKIKLDPTQAQAIYFARACGVARFAYNWALAEWKAQYAAGGKPSEMSLRKQLNGIKSEQFPWMAEVTKLAPEQSIMNLGTAFENFFRRVKQGGKAGYPKFKRRGLHDSFRAGAAGVTCDGKAIKLPRIGWIRMRESLRFEGIIKSATVSKMADGWHVAVVVETLDCLSGPLGGGTVGADLGIKEFATLSNGEVVPSLKPHRAEHARLVRLSRSLSRKQNGSANRAKAKAKLARLHLSIANVRKDALHKLTTSLATRFDIIAIEDLNVSGMVKNRCLARSIADAGFAEFRRQLEYKTAMTGARLHVVDRFFPSSKTCHSCGTIHPMKLSDRVMACECGNVMDRDLNAAMNLEQHAASSAVSVCGESGSGSGRKTGVKPFSVKQKEVVCAD